MNNEILEFINSLRDKHQIELSFQEGELKLVVDKGFEPDPAVIKSIKERKAAIIDFYQSLQGSDSQEGIRQAEKKPFYPLSDAQRGLYVLQELSPESTAFNMPKYFFVNGALDVAKLELAFKQLISDHDILRTSFVEVEGDPVQQIHTEGNFAIERFEGTREDVEGLRKSFVRPFELDRHPLLRVGVIELSDKEYYLMIDTHHIISDGTSEKIIIDHVMKHYMGDSIPASMHRFVDYSEWENSEVVRQMSLKNEKFWLELFTNRSTQVNLPYDFSPTHSGKNGGVHSFTFDQEMIDTITLYCKDHRVSRFTFFLAAFNLFLRKLTGDNDIVVGVTTSGREHQEMEEVIGMFVKTLPVIYSYESEEQLDFPRFLSRVNLSFLDFLEHQHVNFESLANQLGLQRSENRGTWFNVMLNYQNYRQSVARLDGIAMEPDIENEIDTKFDLSLHIQDQENNVGFQFEYDKTLFRLETIEQYGRYFKHLISQLLSGTSMDEAELLNDDDKRRLFTNNPVETALPDTNVVKMIEEMAALRPDAMAVFCEDQGITYRELNESSNRLAHFLKRNFELQADDIVAVCLERDIDMIVPLLAIQKAGAGYTPIDPELNPGRMEAIINNSEARAVITNSDAFTIDIAPSQLVNLNSLKETLNSESTENPGLDIRPDHLAYCIYTSGSTGEPKGILIEHRSLLDFALSTRDSFEITSADSAIQQASLAFDTSVEEIFPTLISGASLRIMPDKGKDIFALIKAIKEQKATILNTSPLILNELNEYAEDLSSVRFIIVGGDALVDSHISNIVKFCDVYQTYGPSEVTVGITCGKVGKKVDASNIGKPITNRKVYIFDSQMHLCPEMVPGELCVAGIGLAREYLNDPDTTNVKFIENPEMPGERIYRTGDLAKWLPDGNIRFLGRIDNQIKIRGIRVELGEIETRMLQYEGVKEAYVILYKKGSLQFLTAYYTADTSIDENKLRNYLKTHLPDYMIPTAMVFLETFPLNTSGKVDRKKLPAPDVNEANHYEPPISSAEKLLADIWKEALHIEKIGAKDNFFSLGGDSIKSIRIVALLRKQGFHFKVRDIFKWQTIREFASVLEEKIAITTLVDKPAAYGDDNIKLSLEQILKREGLENLNTQALAKISELQEQYEIEDIYPLSPMQEGMLFHSLLIESSSNYFSQVKFSVEGDINVEKTALAFSKVVARHTALRTLFVHEGLNKPVQVVVKHKEADFAFLDWSQDIQQKDIVAKFESFLEDDESRGFDLSSDSLMRLTMIKCTDTKYQLVWSYHHILIDGWCMAMIVKEFKAFYHAAIHGEMLELQRATPYRVFIDWLEAFNREEASVYWQNYLKGYENTAGLPQKAGAVHGKQHYKEYHVRINHDHMARIQELSSLTGVSVNTIIQTAWGIVLAKYTNSSDAVFGSVVAGRPAEIEDVEHIMGVFINTIPVRVRYEAEDTINTLLLKNQQKALEGMDHLHLPLSDIQNLSELKSGLFNHVMAFQNLPVEQGDTQEESFSITNVKSIGRTSFDFWMIITPDDGLDICLNYDAGVFDDDTISSVGSHLEIVLNNFVYNPDKRLSEIEILTKNEREQILYQFNDTSLPYSNKKLMHELFEEQVCNTPDHTAIIINGQSYSYKWLNERSNQMANYLRGLGVEAEDAVTVVMKRDIELVIALLAILKSGGKYIPVEPYLPWNRKATIINTVSSRILITDQQEFRERYLDDQEIACLETILENPDAKQGFQGTQLNQGKENEIDFTHYATENLVGTTTSDHLAYVIFTSGSTGNPKGVAVKHHPAVNLIEWVNNTYNINQNDVIFMVSSVSFDLSVYDLFGGLAKGATVRIANEEELASPEMLASIVVSEGVTFWDSAPAMLQQLIPFFEAMPKEHLQKSKLRLSFSSGDWIPLSMPVKMKSLFSNYRFIGLGGATEATIWSNYFEVEKVLTEWSSIPYGKPIQNARYLVLDKDLNLCPIGVKGHLYIGGDCLATCYFNEPELSASRFIDSPFYEGEKLYHTGDMARWYPDGNLEFMGREDSQVKIRGYRVELGEIERRLQQHPDISQVIVHANARSKYDKYICAYYVSENNIDQANLNEFLLQELPAYMLPSFYFRLDEIPVTENGKVNRKKLPTAQDALSKDASEQGVLTETEKALRKIFSKLLQHKEQNISIQDDFFVLGGHSIMAVYLMGEIQNVFGVKLNLRSIFDHSVLQSLALLIEGKKGEDSDKIPHCGIREFYPVSSAQQRLFFHSLMNFDSTLFNIPMAYEIEGDIDAVKVEKALTELTRLHDGLRTNFELDDDGVVQQYIGQDPRISLEVNNLSSGYNLFEAFHAFVKPFDLEQGVLLRFNLMLGQEKSFLLIDIHHIICDGVALNTLMTDFMKLYQGLSVAAPSVRYVDYAQWQKDRKEQLQQQRAFWLEKLDGNIPQLRFPANNSITVDSDNSAMIFDRVLDKNQYSNMKAFCAKAEVSEFMYLLSVYFLLLHKVSGERTIIIETDALGRSKQELFKVVGTFINVLPLKVNIDPETSFSSFVETIKTNVLDSFDNQDYQYDDLLGELNEKNEIEGGRLTNTQFTFINYYTEESKVGELSFKPLKLSQDTVSDYAFKIEAQPSQDVLELFFIGQPQLFENEVLEALADQYLKLVNETLRDSTMPISEINTEATVA
ncbi:amino acid adenylation domain-containing protein [Fulvivirga sp. 29W222]|uniref:Amino acid adenylation domain-containing protein n=1 Tax=Fulvivirga marina TaxID=2494733 RepID=A0A937G430_9BACT|nr:non-ribosomal peptide synthetase [Fulvivirga marina]MBL6449610.1 amino acid adenylation domain-containing protein [Fulvivirga marina]